MMPDGDADVLLAAEVHARGAESMPCTPMTQSDMKTTDPAERTACPSTKSATTAPTIMPAVEHRRHRAAARVEDAVGDEPGEHAAEMPATQSSMPQFAATNVVRDARLLRRTSGTTA